MRLKGYFRAGPLEGAYLTAVVAVPKLNIRQSIELLIDTGATKTAILDKDVLSMGISYARLGESKQPLLGLGGVVGTFVARDAELYFRTDEGAEHRESLTELLVVRHDKIDENILRIPSVLGRDILNKLRLIYDKRNGTVAITDEP
ncbi:MAG: hypothetical protein HYU39_07515 [Thaumarchaeota archaeon]|nr:hypothetical protein [Nitrososphaerota archaeon]